MVHSARFQVATRGNCHVVDITPPICRELAAAGLRSGIACVFVVGSTASITTTEAEPGLLHHDLAAFFERIAPEDGDYQHEQTWHDDNGHSHVRASALGPSVTLPLIDGRLALGTWQQIVLIDFDTQPRQREVIVQLVGE